MQDLVPVEADSHASQAHAREDESQYVVMRIGEQNIGISVLSVQDIIRPRTITEIPLAPREVAGVLNLRGRIVTAIDLRVRLGLSPQEDVHSCMSIVTPYKDDLYSFLVDDIGDVLTLPHSKFEKCPANMEKQWRDVAKGVYNLDDKLMVVLDVERLLTFDE